MAVYTQVSAEALSRFLADYDVGDLVSAKGIAEGVENTNYLIETNGRDGRGDRFILTLYEKRVAAGDLPFFMALLDHLAARGLPVPPAIRDRAGREIRELAGRPACLIRFLPGVSLSQPTAAQAHAAGASLASMHRAVADFAPTRPNTMGADTWAALFDRCGADLDRIDSALRDDLARGLDAVLPHWPADGDRCVIHADLFPDNVLMMGDRVTGLIDFYFACSDLRLYDVAVSHTSWTFGADGRDFDAAVGTALLDGYGFAAQQRAVLPVLCMGACLRFALSRAWDWLNTPADALVTRKDPLAYTRRLAFYREHGATLFA